MIAFWSGRAVSENRRLAPGGKRWYASEDYRSFKESVAWAVKPHAEQFPGPVSVRLIVRLNARMDAQNIIKPVLDALQAVGVVKDDKQVRSLHLHREDTRGKEPDHITIMVSEVR